MSVKVAVRVRPFNQREKDNNSILCIDMVFFSLNSLIARQNNEYH